MASAIDDAGFEIRDVFIGFIRKIKPRRWVFHFIKKMNIGEKAKKKSRKN